MQRALFASIGLAGLALTLALGTRATAAKASQAPQTNEAQPENPQPDMGQRIMASLKQTEGCLGVDAAEWSSGRRSIAAWFENKAAVVEWYHSPMHRMLMGAAGGPDGEPLEHVQDPDLPIMVVATITMGGEPAVQGPIPFSQISIEMYTPLPGGASINGRLSPDAFPIEHIRQLDTKADDE